jgi:heme exporter protein A
LGIQTDQIKAKAEIRDEKGEWAILAEGLTRSFGNLKALRGIDLQLKRGRFLTIFGPNGAGKTTLIKVLATVLSPSSGRLEIMGLNAKNGGDTLRHRLGLLSHNTFLYPHLTPYENLKFYGTMYGVGDLADRSEEVLREVDMWERRHQPVGTLSRGLQQRAAIARAIIHNPEIIFLDEPFTGLDQQAAQKFRLLLDKLRPGLRTMVMSSHNIQQGLEMGQEVAILVRGRIVYQAASNQLARDDFEQLYLSLVS